jgi:hypothetical protein
LRTGLIPLASDILMAAAMKLTSLPILSMLEMPGKSEFQLALFCLRTEHPVHPVISPNQQ